MKAVLLIQCLLLGSRQVACAGSPDAVVLLQQTAKITDTPDVQATAVSSLIASQRRSILQNGLSLYKTDMGYAFEDLERATLARDQWGALASLPALERLKALDTDGDEAVSEKELQMFTGLDDSFCRSLGEVQFGCKNRCDAGKEDFDGNALYLASKGVDTYTFAHDVDSYKAASDAYSAGAITLAQKRAISMGLAQVVLDRVEGATCEFGVFTGHTSTFLHNMLNKLHASDSNPLHLFDSFEGLPDCDKTKDLGMCGPGEMAIGQDAVRATFLQGHLPVPPMHKGYFSDIPDSEFPDQIAFAFIDGDLYPSMFTALQRVWPRLSVGGIVMLHDYAWEGYPGTELAAHDFLKDKAEKVQMVGTEHGVACNIGLIRKQS